MIAHSETRKSASSLGAMLDTRRVPGRKLYNVGFDASIVALDGFFRHISIWRNRSHQYFYSPNQLPRKTREFHIAWTKIVVSRFPLLAYKIPHVQPKTARGIAAVGDI
jgi:hypothetical protein